MVECTHNWIYEEGICYPTDPMQRRKICKKCGKIEFEHINCKSENKEEFDKIYNKFYKRWLGGW